MAAQQLSRQAFSSPAEVVAWMGAMQAQEYEAAKWAVGVRLPEGTATDGSIERALSDGELLRTHALRGTWQLVAPADVHWLLALMGPRVIEKNARRYRELGLDADAFRRANAVFAKALADRDLTRDELATALAKAGVSPAGQRMPYLLQRAELDGLVCSGARRGKQLTWALLERRAPRPGKLPSREDALAELALRYFQSRGPATLEDFTWWSGLTSADARAALESIRSKLAPETTGERTCWQPAGAPGAPRSKQAHLLPAFDELLIGYRNRDDVLDPARVAEINADGGMLDPIIVAGGRVIGTWRRTLRAKSLSIELGTFDEAAAPARSEMLVAARRYGAFLQTPECRVSFAAKPPIRRPAPRR